MPNAYIFFRKMPKKIEISMYHNSPQTQARNTGVGHAPPKMSGTYGEVAGHRFWRRTRS